jgi:tetratricopeptide (TPR) repeat protein
VAAFDASARIVEERSLSKESLDLHSIDFLLYARLQKGLYREAHETLDLLSRIQAEVGDRAPWLSDYVRSKRAVYAVETESWEPLGASTDRGALLANALSAIHRRRYDDVEALLDRCRAEAAKGDAAGAELFKWRAACDEVEGLLLFRRGATEGGLALLEAAHRHELEGGPAWETPDPVKPPAELLGELYLELGRYEVSASFFEATLERRPGRSRSLLGLARALSAGGSDERARQIYARLSAQWEEADESVAELAEVRKLGQLAP